MMSDPWLTILGLGEDGLPGLSDASRTALAQAEIVFGGPRHLALIGAGARGRDWPVPFSVDPVLALRGQKVVVLASGDPFWFGAGGSLSRHLSPGEWVAHPAPSTFSRLASQLGWRLEEVACLGLHAAPLERLIPVLSRGVRAIVLLRDGQAPSELAGWLTSKGYGPSRLVVAEALGGPAERIRTTTADAFDLGETAALVAVAIEADGAAGLPRASGLPDDLFAHDGQITKRPVRALALSALAPRPGERLWDLGAGSGSISIEWALAGGLSCAVERRADRCANITTNITAFGLSHRITLTNAASAEVLAHLPPPDAVFIGGGGDTALLTQLWSVLLPGVRIVIHGVTLETETLLATWQAEKGGELMRIELATAAPLGRMRGWTPARPVVQWSVTR